MHKFYIAIALTVVALSGSAWTGYRLGRAAGDRAVLTMYTASVELIKKKERANKEVLNAYRDQLQALSDVAPPVRRVRVCPSVSAAPGRIVVAGSGNIPADSGTDIGQDLADLANRADKCAAQLNALILAVQ